MTGYLTAPSGAHGHFPARPGLTASLGSSLSGVPMPGLGAFGLPHSLDPVGFPQGKNSLFLLYQIIINIHAKEKLVRICYVNNSINIHYGSG